MDWFKNLVGNVFCDFTDTKISTPIPILAFECKFVERSEAI